VTRVFALRILQFFFPIHNTMRVVVKNQCSSRTSLLISEMLQGLGAEHSCKMRSEVWTEPHSHWLDAARLIFTMVAKAVILNVASRWEM